MRVYYTAFGGNLTSLNIRACILRQHHRRRARSTRSNWCSALLPMHWNAGITEGHA